ncbi:Hypothetical protein LOCK908_2372 [Lacticaseibacillus rhamnosus LOCK908]|uniref:Uncharacterized protein n=1 Tax=Lacticaseibacillus rhamnosus (strain LMS2-1) TaxID=525361 RepID=C2JZ14_LACRM|nr:conserved hypothetical protein [Lacticaseibacillus rhamnosus ATCC 8530]AGP74993.1 Hypothetical protein LOCK908_2372 [Lacticaseibacillus rhamnosus LOCK908]ASY48236.1 hypothetical protein N507_1052 [Lacticaseibacillus rhamnosus DSM 14870]EEN79734.1 hypothetical protein HMPREF0539_2149 [Lacticaseibacillus rhamnosus LMS2-1]
MTLLLFLDKLWRMLTKKASNSLNKWGDSHGISVEVEKNT